MIGHDFCYGRTSIIHLFCDCGCFFINNKRLMKVIHLCQNQQLPLMREQYTFKMSFDQRKEINPLIIDNARLYIEDMVNVIRNYY